MANERSDTKTKILETAAEIVGREKNLNLTIREIAKRAGVNLASVNYYFGSKKNLLQEVEKMLMENVLLVYADLENEDLPIKDRLVNWADSLIKNMIDYPGIIYLIGTRVLKRDNTIFNVYLSLLETDITPLVKELSGLKDTEEVKYKVLQLISGIVYPALIISSESEASALDLSDSITRKKYVSALVKSLENC